jgi:hypothetical protein
MGQRGYETSFWDTVRLSFLPLLQDTIHGSLPSLQAGLP